MHITHTLSLSQDQARAIHAITALCRQTNHILLSCPDDGDEFWLLYDDCGEMSACFAIYRMAEASWECSAFTRPDRRGRGYFSALLEQVCSRSQAQGEPDLYFVTDQNCRHARRVLEHLGAELLYHEYMMEREIDSDEDASAGNTHMGKCSGQYEAAPSSPLSITSQSTETDECVLLCAWLPEAVYGPDVTYGLDSAYGPDAPSGPDAAYGPDAPSGPDAAYGPDVSASPGPDSAPIGTCRISFHPDSAYLYALEIRPDLRGQGLGTRFVRAILSWLREQGCARLRLQVSGSNDPALRLYKKTGFHITETLSYYLY